MGSSRNRIILAGTAFSILLVTTIVMTTRPDDELPAAEAEAIGQLPSVDAETVTELELRAPGEPKIRLTKTDGGWRLVEPVEAEANANYVQLALRKLGELGELHRGIAATRADNHERLEVAESNGVEVIAKRGGETIAHVFVGAFKGGATMLRVAGEETVHAMRGSLKASFNRKPSDWRERKIVDEAAAEVRQVRFANDEGSFHFERGEDNSWAAVEGAETIEDFDSNRVQSLVSSLSRMRAADFAGPDVDWETAGIDDSSSTATLVLDGGEIVLRLGNPLDGGNQFYLLREGRDPIYVVSKFLAERIAPGPEQFQVGAQEPVPSAEDLGAPNTGGRLPEGVTKEQLDQIMEQFQKTPVKLGQGGVKAEPGSR
jgi:hypothetical protein